MIRVVPFRFFLALSAAFALCACGSDLIRESGSHPDGSPAWEREYLALEDGRKMPHGSDETWHPANGPRRTLRFFDRGRLQGYSFEWNARGELIRLVLCEDGTCVPRALPAAPPRAALVLANTRFRKSSVRVASAPNP